MNEDDANKMKYLTDILSYNYDKLANELENINYCLHFFVDIVEQHENNTEIQ